VTGIIVSSLRHVLLLAASTLLNLRSTQLAKLGASCVTGRSADIGGESAG